jgi:type IV fimbrial biogenesis protein FimT
MKYPLPQQGFTLIELLVTVGVAGILFAIAVPSFRSFLQDSRSISQANLMVQSLNVARSEAIKRDIPVDVCPSSDGLTCNAGLPWAQGWIVVDVQAAPDPPFQIVGPISGNNTLIEANGNTSVRFLPSGLVVAGATLTLCDQRGVTKARQVEINITGRIASSSMPGVAVTNVPVACP